MSKSNIVMIGMPGAGKSTVGVVLAKTMGMGFVDVDLVICQINGGSLQEIVDRTSHEEFLKLEGSAAKTLVCSRSIIATGGSMIYSADAMEHLKEMGVVIYLKAQLSDLEARITNMQTRGIAFKPGETLADLYAERTPLYEKWADITVEVSSDASIEETAKRIKSEINDKNALSE